MINLNQIKKGLILNNPMKVAVFQNLLNPTMQNELASLYPKFGFEKIERKTSPGKLYSFSMIQLVEKREMIFQSALIHPIWQDFICSLLNSEYSKALSCTLDIDLSDTQINIGLYQFKRNDYVEPHIDHEDKIVTQIFYFNTFWDINNGGLLQLLSENDEDSSFLSIPPLSMYSVAIVRGEAAWHAVTPLAEQSDQARLSLQLEYYRV